MGRVAKGQRGASAVEFAVITPLFVALLFAIVEFGMVLYTKGMMTHAAREGARYGVVYSTPRRDAVSIENEVKQYLNLSGLTNEATVTVSGAGGNTGDILDVKVTYNYEFMVLPKDINSYLAGTMPDLTLTAETVMRME